MRYLTSYLSHPLVIDPPPGVLRVQVCRSVMHFQRDRVDFNADHFAPHADLSAAIREIGDAAWWRDVGLPLDATSPHWLDLNRKAEEAGAHTVLLLCHEASPRRCHRRRVWEYLPCGDGPGSWSLDHELVSKHGGRAKLEENDDDD